MRKITQTLLLTCILLFIGHFTNAQCNSTNYNAYNCPEIAQQSRETSFVADVYQHGTRAAAGDTFYLRSNTENPWGSTTNQNAMNVAFGAGNWTEVFYQTVDPSVLFSSATRFVFMEGSNASANALNAFLTANLTLIENWVTTGKTLLINAAPNEGGNINLGFGGSVLNYLVNVTQSASVTVVDTNHPAFLGPNLPVSITMSGTDYSHAYITGTGFTNLLIDSSNPAFFPLREKAWGNGRVMMGGMTTVNWHSPATESFNWRANLLVYLEGLAKNIICPADIVVSNDPDTCGAIVTFADATATDINGDPLAVTQTAGPASGSVFPIGDTLVEFTAEDNGTIITCSFTVTVEDNEAPAIICPGNITTSNDLGTCGAIVNYLFPEPIDNCEGFTPLRLAQNNEIFTDALDCQATESGHLRIFDLQMEGVTNDYQVDNIAVGIWSSAGNAIMTVNIYLNHQIVNPLSSYVSPISNQVTPYATTTSLVPAGNTFMHNIPMDVFIPVNSVVYVEVLSPSNADFLVGYITNTTTETSPGYIACSSGTVYNTPLSYNYDWSSVISIDGRLQSNTSTIQTAGLPPLAIFPVGTTTNTFIVTDAAGNTATCSFDVIIEDNEAPLAICVAPFNLALDANGEASLTAQMLDNGSTDNCNDLTYSFTETGTAFAEVNENQNLTITLPTGAVVETVDFASYGTPNGSNGNYTIGACHAANSQSIVESYALGNNSFTIPASNGVFGDPCGGTFKSLYVTVSYTTVATELNFSCADIGDNTVTLTVTDASGNSSTCTTVVTIVDDLSPEITCVADQTVDTDAGFCSYTHSGTSWDATATDNCSIATTEYELTGATTGTGTTLDGVVFNLGETTVTWTTTDGSGNIDSCSFTVTVEDNEVPVITCVGNQTMDTDAGVCTYTHSGTTWDATATDNCSIATIEYVLTGVTTGTGTTLDGVTFNLGETTVTWTTTDGSDNTAECSFTVTVEDNEVPVIACVTNQTIDTDAGVCTYTHNGTAWDATATDNCSIATTVYVLTGVTTGTGTTLDGVAFNLGETTVTWTTTDGSDNTDECSFTVTVEDNEAPQIVCVANQRVDTDFNLCTYTHNGTAWDATATDNCSIATTVYELTGATTGTGTTLDGVTFNLGETTVTWTTTDGSGNTNDCSFTVTVEDNQAPQIVCPLDIIIDADPGMCGAQVFFGNAIALDACSGPIATVQTAGPASGSVFPVGDTVISFSATDAAGNVATCSFTITVEDNQAPLAVCQNITIQLGADGVATISAEDLNGGSTDNCAGILTYTASQTSFDCSHVGENTITLTVTDEAGNSSTCTAIVMVEDTIAPVAMCAAPFTIQLDASGSSSITVADIDNGSTDNCGNSVITLSQSTFTCADLGENTITLTITDASGNTATCTTVVTVEDTIAPIVSCIDFTLELGADGTALLTPEDIGGTSTDNCAITITAIDVEEFDCSDIGTPVLVTYFASDASGNISSCTAMVTVVDMSGPVIDCPEDQTVDSDPDSITYTLPDYFGEGLVTATDNCTIPVTIFSQTPAPGTLLPDGTYTITLTAEDEYGNETVCEFELTVDTILGTEDNRLDFSSLTMYPNPAEYTVTIGNPKFMEIDNINVYDIQGRLVLSKNTGGATGNQTLEVGHLASAVYMVVIESNGKQAVKRLIRK